MEAITIRDAGPEDGPAVFALLRDFVTSYAPSEEAFARHFPAILAREDADLLVAVRDGAVVGYALAARFPTLYANGPVAFLQELMVDCNHRERGIGRALVTAILDRARAADCAELTLATRRAGDFYRKLGFTESAGYFKRPAMAP
jgi:predicted N-acetyltransferase YhbS